ncbi:hypothetical protein V5799_033166 [Amblyomma americanum]|uniref:Uncharacterized protein n=1 Tax=Amblyomma americanum TaxID=6943 RepID=A0AAQ4DP36_AMBAM
MDEAKCVLDDAESLCLCMGVGKPADFVAVSLTKGLEKQLIRADGLILSKKCRGSVISKEARRTSCGRDFPHLIKCLRNSLLKTGFTTPEGKVSVRPVREEFLRDNNVRTLKVMPGFTEAHLDPNSFEKIRVSYAFQLFGSNVLRGMMFYKNEIERKCGSITATKDFFA